MTENSKRLFFTIVFALVFYVTGASFVQSFVNYPTWKLIGEGEFQIYHNQMSPLIVKFMVLPWLLEIALTVLMFWLRPRIVPVGAVALALIFNLVAVASTVIIQIPIQIELGENGLSLHAIDKLLETDPIRWASGILRAFLYVWMMSRVVRSADIIDEAQREAFASTSFSNAETRTE